MKSDQQLQHDVIAELKWDPEVDATQIGVEVKDGVVILAGHVQSYPHKWNAERAALRVSGVMALTVEIEVRLPGLSERGDVDIARSAENVLQWTINANENLIQVMVEAGWITLSGQVDWGYQRLAAIAAVRHLMGVKGVSDSIVVKPGVELVAAQSEIETALQRRSKAGSGKIAVHVHGNDVTLTGTVHSWLEREQATNSAWSTPGVRNVVDRITIAQ